MQNSEDPNQTPQYACDDVSFLSGSSLNIQGSVVQSIVSLTSSLVVKILTALVSTISNSQLFLLKKNVSSFCLSKSYSDFSAKIIAYMPYLMIKGLTIRRFERLSSES